MVKRNSKMSIGILVVVLVLILPRAFPAQSGENPETVVVTYRAKPGAEAQLAAVISRQWSTGRHLNLFRETPHVTVKGTETGNRVYFIEILTWRDAQTPDAPPEEIRAVWGEMNKLVESRDGHRGIEITPVSVVGN